MFQTQISELIHDSLNELFQNISIDFYLFGEEDFSFSVPILEFDIQYKNKDYDEIEKTSLNVAIEVVFRPIKEGLEISHRAFLYKPDTKEFIESKDFIKSKKYNYDDIVNLIQDCYGLNKIKFIGNQNITTKAQTFLNNDFKLENASSDICKISELLIEKIQFEFLHIGITFDKLDFIEEREKHEFGDPHFDTPHVYLLKY